MKGFKNEDAHWVLFVKETDRTQQWFLVRKFRFNKDTGKKLIHQLRGE